jgi:hypothetical protein
MTSGGLEITAGGQMQIASDGVTTARILNSNVTTAKIAGGAVTPAKLSTGAPSWTTNGAITALNVIYLANDGFKFSSDGAVDTGMSWSSDGVMNVVCNGEVPGQFTTSGWTGYSAYATRADNGPSNGTFTQNHTANNNKIYVGGFGAGKGFGILCQRAANENASALHFTKENGVVVGSIVLDTANSTNYNTTSDYRLKKDFYPISSGLSKVNLLKPTNFKWIDTDARTDGFIAHEVQDVFPNAVTGEKDAIDENGNPIYQQIDQSKLIPIMVAAIQELSQKVAQLESR